MTQEDKELLLKDLCARLPYGVIGEYSWKGNEPHNRELTGNLYDELNSSWSSSEDSKFIPYLRPMSSMTEEEENEWCGLNIDPLLEAVNERHTRIEDLMLRAKSQYKPLDWLNAHHFDYRGLIEKGLAVAVTEENNPYEN